MGAGQGIRARATDDHLLDQKATQFKDPPPVAVHYVLRHPPANRSLMR